MLFKRGFYYQFWISILKKWLYLALGLSSHEMVQKYLINSRALNLNIAQNFNLSLTQNSYLHGATDLQKLNSTQVLAQNFEPKPTII